MNKTGIVWDERFLLHDAGYGHPESPERLSVTFDLLDEKGVLDDAVIVEPREATAEELYAVHTKEHVNRVISTKGTAFRFDGDTATSPESVEAALLAAGGTIKLTEDVVSGKLKNGFALIRPPGHHAEPNHSMGFCIFNNIAVAAKYAIDKLGLERVLVVDWDIHHGNGTQWIFYKEPSVLYFSTHLYPYYPGTGAFSEEGDDDGRGYTVNVPLVSRMGDADYQEIFKSILVPIADEFKPQLVMVSAGYDIADGDPLGSMRVTPDGFALMTSIIMDIAEKHCGGKVVMALEGGYGLKALSLSIKATIETLLGCREPVLINNPALHPAIQLIINEARKVQLKNWKNLK